MADDLIYCPSCRFKLQLPPELYGQTVECPQCHSRFTAPVPQAAAPPVVRPVQPVTAYPDANYGPTYGADTDELAWRAAAASVRGPAIALLIVSLLATLLWGFVILSAQAVKSQPQAMWDAEIQKQLDQNPQLTAEERTKLVEMLTRENVAYYMTVGGGIGVALNLLTALGAVMMMRLRGYGLAVLGSILALNPLNTPCCLLEVPFGLWALIVLLNGDVRRAFR
jgi:hypothetical protein